jgi:lipopolysaccharide export LptBFGC system permease protein LptF
MELCHLVTCSGLTRLNVSWMVSSVFCCVLFYFSRKSGARRSTYTSYAVSSVVLYFIFQNWDYI